MASMNPREQAAELLIRIVSDIDQCSPARQFMMTDKGRTYLRNLGEALPYRFSELRRWIAETCPPMRLERQQGRTGRR